MEMDNKIRGSLYGFFLGDYLGNEKESGKGFFSDDTEMTICVLKGIIKDSKRPEVHIWENFKNWFKVNPKGIGKTVSLAIKNGLIYDDPYYGAQVADNILLGRSAGNGSLMRTLGIPLFYSDLNFIIALTSNISNMTHKSVEAREASILYAYLVHLILSGVEKHKAIKIVFKDHIIYNKYLVDNIDKFLGGAFVESTLQMVIKVFYESSDYLGGIELAINKSEDKDTVGSLTGGLLGLSIGYEGIEKYLVKYWNEFKSLDIHNIINKFIEKRNENA